MFRSAGVYVANINCGRRVCIDDTICGCAFPEYKLANRIQVLYDSFDGYDIVVLCEVSREFISHLKKSKLFRQYKYCSMSAYNLDEYSLWFVVLSNVEVLHSESYPLTKDGKHLPNEDRPDDDTPQRIIDDIKNNQYGALFEKSVFCVSFLKYEFWIVHLGLQNKMKTDQLKRVRWYINIFRDQTKPAYLMGDFNCFNFGSLDKQIYMPQFKAFEDWKWESDSGMKVGMPFPYDIVFSLPKELKKKYFELYNSNEKDSYLDFRNFCLKHYNPKKKYGCNIQVLSSGGTTKYMKVNGTACRDHFYLSFCL